MRPPKLVWIDRPDDFQPPSKFDRGSSLVGQLAVLRAEDRRVPVAKPIVKAHTIHCGRSLAVNLQNILHQAKRVVAWPDPNACSLQLLFRTGQPRSPFAGDEYIPKTYSQPAVDAFGPAVKNPWRTASALLGRCSRMMRGTLKNWDFLGSGMRLPLVYYLNRILDNGADAEQAGPDH